MIKSVDNLKKINIVCYISFALYIFLNAKFEPINWVVLAAFMPYILVAFSASTLLNFSRKNYSIIRKRAFFDLIVRILSMLSSYILFRFDISSLMFYLSITLIIILLVVNVFIEKSMKKIVLGLENNKVSKIDHEINKKDITNYNNMKLSVKKAIYEIPIFLIVLFLINGLQGINYYEMKIASIIVAILLLLKYFSKSFESLTLYYKEKEKIRKVYLKENTLVIGSIFVASMYQLYIFFGGQYRFDFLIILIENIIVYPNYKNRYNRALDINEIGKRID